mgnify:CR=1 FL=1
MREGCAEKRHGKGRRQADVDHKIQGEYEQGNREVGTHVAPLERSLSLQVLVFWEQVRRQRAASRSSGRPLTVTKPATPQVKTQDPISAKEMGDRNREVR